MLRLRPRSIVGPDGTLHIRLGVPRRYLRDLYSHLLTVSWEQLWTVVAAASPLPTDANLPRRPIATCFGFENKFQVYERLFSLLRYCKARYSRLASGKSFKVRRTSE
jgi:hypothetical protein